MMDMRQIALNLMKNKIQQNNGNQAPPWLDEAIQCIQNNDSAKGVELANNLCNAMGMSREDAMKQAQDMLQNNPMFQAFLK